MAKIKGWTKLNEMSWQSYKDNNLFVELKWTPRGYRVILKDNAGEFGYVQEIPLTKSQATFKAVEFMRSHPNG